MTKTDALLALSSRQRRFEWELARDEQTRAAGRFVAGKTHDLLNLIQIVQLASLELGRRCDPTAREFVEDLQRAAGEAQRSLSELMAVARPEEVIVRGAPVGAVVASALAALHGAVAVEIRLEAAPATATRAGAQELEHLLIGLALDAAGGAGSATGAPEDAGARAIALVVRERSIDGEPWLEIVRSSEASPAGDRFELRVVEAIAHRAGGEVATSDRRGGGEELVVALPIVPCR